jgi:hypothetical protein
MKHILHATVFTVVCLLLIATSCKKSSSEFNFNTAVTATFNGTTQQYVVPAGFVGTNNGFDYAANGYEANAASNTIEIQINDSISGKYLLTANGNGNFVQITNNGTTYLSSYNLGASAGVINLTFTGNKITGTFSGTLYGTGLAYKDSLVVTNGTISTSY